MSPSLSQAQFFSTLTASSTIFTSFGSVYFATSQHFPTTINIVSSMGEWLECRAYDQHALGLKPTCTILLCPWVRHFMALSPAWWCRQAVLNYSHTSVKLQVDSNIFVSLKAGQGNCIPYVLAPPLLSCKSKG